MDIKLIEIRDRGTFIAAAAIRIVAKNEPQRWLLAHYGYPGTLPGDWNRPDSCVSPPAIILMHLSNQKATSDPYEWGQLGLGVRTMPTVHHWLESHFDEIDDGAVIDVEFLLHETPAPKKSERENRL